MKKTLFPIIFLILGCASLDHIPPEINIYAFDYTKYLDKGFYIYEDCYNGDYKLVANINIDYYQEGKKGYNPKLQNASEGTWIFSKINTDEILELIYEYAMKFNADGVMKFGCTRITKEVYDPGKGNIEVSGIRISGSAFVFE